ncbi:hypothetical protein ABK905_20895 [Acerihabitans sp. KWT182]|uniref:Tox-PLDMTX domain-containing protein n=1 Tax=Acerihabitans sp. KWT182 TaxID=3157919 RepID=A0AAU7Q737_9GAMM
MLLSNALAGAGSALYLHQAAVAQDAQERAEAWESALLGIIMTGLSGADDIYSLIKSYGCRGYKTFHETALKLGRIINPAGSVGAAETFVKGKVRERTAMMVRSLLQQSDATPGLLGQSNVEAMLRILQICGRINPQQYQIASKKSFISGIYSQLKAVHEKESLNSIPSGYELAVLENDSNKVKLMLLSLGSNKFAGFGLQGAEQSSTVELQWQEMTSEDFSFDNKNILLNGISDATLYVEDLKNLPSESLEDELIQQESVLATKFRRFCNKIKYDGENQNILSGVGRFAHENGFKDIRYRVLFVFDPAQESQIDRHYVLLARYKNVMYVMEPSAEEIRYIKIPDIEDVMILREEKWKNAFENSESRVLITYKDFMTEQEAKDYNHTFDIRGNGESVLLSPAGFLELDNTSKPIAFSLFSSHYDSIGQQALLQKKIRANLIKDRLSENSYEFVMSILKEIGIVTLEKKKP